jgi:CxxC-x17-CxxC domain-containing protein
MIGSTAMPGEPQEDKFLTCVDCGTEFAFSARDQAFYQERGFQPPRRCKTCRDKRKTGGGGGGGSSGGGYGSSGGGYGGGSGGAPSGSAQKEHFKVQCSGCGVETTVPFKPDPNRPVYCRNCYLTKKKSPA